MHYAKSVEDGSAQCGTATVTDKGIAFQKFIWTGNEDFLKPFGGIRNFGSTGNKTYKQPKSKQSKKSSNVIF